MNPRLLCAAFLALPAFVPAQTAPAPRPASAPTSTATDDGTVVLTPFEVTTSASDTYQALNTNSLSGTLRELSRVPITADVLNRTFMEDLGVNTGSDLLRDFAPGVALFSQGGATSTGTGVQESEKFSFGQYFARGVGASVPKRNGFLDSQGTVIDLIGVEKTEIIRGPQALLYGRGEAGGVINFVSKPALFGKNSLRLLARTDDEDSFRGEFDANVGTKRVALRLSAFDSNQKFWRIVNDNKSEGLYAQAAIRPFSGTTVRLEFEKIYEDRTTPGLQRLAAGSPGVLAPLGNALLTMPVAFAGRLREAYPAFTGTDADIFNGRLNWSNVNAVATSFEGRRSGQKSYTATLEQKVTDRLSFQLMAVRSDFYFSEYALANSTGLLAPGFSTNPFPGAWAIGGRFQVNAAPQENEGYRGSGVFKFDFARGKHEFVFGAERREKRVQNGMRLAFYETDANGVFLLNAAQANNADAGRTLMPLVYVNLNEGFTNPFTRDVRDLTIAGRRYVFGWDRRPGAGAATATNPLGINLTGTPVFFDTKESAFFGVLFSSWFSDRLDTMIGLRRDGFEQVNPLTTLTTIPKTTKTNGNVGAVWHVTKGLGLYAGASRTFKPNEGLTLDLSPVPFGEGEGFDVGVKSDLLDGRLSGSVTYFRTKVKNERQVVPAVPDRDIVDPAGINGRRLSVQPVYGFDRESNGYEANLTGKIKPNWRVMLSYSNIQGRETSDVFLPRFYNDEFRVNAAGQVTLDNGTPLSVPVAPNTPNFNPLAPTPGVPTQILTLAMLRSGDANGNYRAILDPLSGRIANAGALYLATAGVGTGRTGLPITQHQIGFTPVNGPAATYLARKSGDRLNFASRHSLSLTTNYDVRSRPLRGLGLGGNLRFRFDPPGYFYTTTAGVRKLAIWEDIVTVDVFASYQRRLFRDRVVWRTQLNVRNVLDTVNLRYAPNANGIVENVFFDQAPRTWAWTNTFSF